MQAIGRAVNCRNRATSVWRGLKRGANKPTLATRTLCTNNADNGDAVPAQADVVVVGGGAIGCSSIYHLAKLGVTNAVLLEKDELTAGTTWHTAGLLWRLRPNETEMNLCNITRNLVNDLEEESGVHTGFHMNGGLFIANTKERLKEYKRLQSFGRVMGVESYILSPEESKRLYPLMNVDDVIGSLYSPTDGHLDPAGYCASLTRAAKKNGAKIMTRCAVTNIETEVDDFGSTKVKAVVTEKGRIETNNVLVCGGCWSPYLVEQLGIRLPQYTFRHSYIVTERMEGVVNMPSIRDHELSIYLKVQGDVLQVGGYEMNPVILDEGVARDFSFGLYDLDWDAFGGHIESACHRIPQVAESGIRSTVSGPESFTPDGHPLMGPNPHVKGLFHAHGYNSGGMMMSGGSGLMLAQWMIKGQPELDMFGYDIRRFNSKLLENQQWIRERTHEHYAKHYSIHFHFDEDLSGREAIKDVLYETLANEGCFYQSKGGWERPGWYDSECVAPPLPYDYYGQYGYEKNEPYPYNDQLVKDYSFDYPLQHELIGEECVNARTKANLFNMSYFGKFYITGEDATKAVEWIFSNNMDKDPGSTTYTCMLNSLGGIDSDLTVSVVEDDGPQARLGVTGRSYYAAVGGVFSPYVYTKMMETITKQKFKCQIHDLSHEMVLLSLQGPRSREILSRLTDTDLCNESFPFSSHQLINVAGHDVRAMRLSFIGEMGWELHAPNHAALDIYHALFRVGKELGLRNSGYRAMDSLSVEKGYRMWHSDIRSDDSPLEADMTFTCKLKTDKPFLGREAVEKLKQEGIKKRLVCFTLNQPMALHGLEAIYRDGVNVGYLRRGEFGFNIDKQIGWGYVSNPEGGKVNKNFIMSGKYQLDRMGHLVDAQAHMKSPFDPKNKRIQGWYEEVQPEAPQQSALPRAW